MRPAFRSRLLGRLVPPVLEAEDTMTDIGIGDVLVTRGSGWASRLIRIGAAMLDKPNTVNHVAIVHHQDANGTWWAIEGRPGGVGWRQATDYLKNPFTLTNAAQPKTPVQRQDIADEAEGLLHTGYDWVGIGLDTMDAVAGQHAWLPDSNGTVPAHVVCSSLAAWIYFHLGLARPTGSWRTITPADWANFIILHRWQQKVAA